MRQGLAASDETGPGFAGPILFGLLALQEPDREAQEAAISAGESLLAKGAVGHNHFWFRRYAIEQALLTGQWDAADRHADALLTRMSVEPLAYSNIVARRGQLLGRRGAGAATAEDESELDRLRAKAAEVDLRIDALGEALRRP